MCLKSRLFFFGVLAFLSLELFAQGLDSVPLLNDVSITASVEVNDTVSPREFTYDYSIANGVNNTGKIWNIKLDVSSGIGHYPPQYFPQSTTSTLYDGSTLDMVFAAERLAPFSGKLGSKVVPIGIQTPLGWSGAYNRDGTAGVSVADSSSLILPGQQFEGVSLTSRHPPSLREATFIASWFYVSEDGDEISPEIDQQISEAMGQIQVQQITLGPSPYPESGTARHWDVFVKDVEQLIELGWITNNTLENQIQQTVQSADQAIRGGDPSLAKQLLAAVVDDINNALPEDMRAEAKQLLIINVNELIANTPDTSLPIEPVYEFSPEFSERSVSEPYDLTITVRNAADIFSPLENHPVSISCSFVDQTGVPGGCQKLSLSLNLGPLSIFFTDSNGQVMLSATTPMEGQATFNIGTFGGEVEIGQALVKWSGGTDLAVPAFIPPSLRTSPNAEIFLTDITKNFGSLPTASTITRYFLSATTPVDPNHAVILGERLVEPLNSGGESESIQIPFTIPADLASGEYYLLACADAENTENETSEGNNCSDIQLDNFVVQTIPIERTEERPSIDITDGQAFESDSGVTTLNLDITLDYADAEKDISVEWNTVEGEALQGEDYTSGSGVVIFEANTSELTQSIGVDILGDLDIELDETFNVVLSNPSEFVNLGKQIGIVTILNDDEDAITISCDNAYASLGTLWPPNHKFKKVGVSGIEDFSNSSIDIYINSIFQDEPLDTTGDGNTEPDGKGVGTNYAEVRSERSGNGDGRVYEIGFTATNSVGGTCSGIVFVGVPHDKKDTPIDSSVRYNSTGI